VNEPIEVKSLVLGGTTVVAKVLGLSNIEPGCMYVCYKTTAPKNRIELQGFQSGFIQATEGTGQAVPAMFLVSLETLQEGD
jgi:hypothetical protein